MLTIATLTRSSALFGRTEGYDARRACAAETLIAFRHSLAARNGQMDRKRNFPRTATARCIASGLRIERSCCGPGDVVKTKFKVLPADRGHPEDAWFAWLNERWEQIPPQKIVSDFAPDGQAYLFVLHVGDKTNWAASGYDVVICFVRPRGGL
jgi:hypothetical protein